jgi:RNA polymerase sigma-70 factor (ECF subfamily)
MPTDEQLIVEYLKGDEAALRTLIERYLTPVYKFVSRYVRTSGDAEDITQDTFLNAWRAIRAFDERRRFKTWIFTIAKHTALNWLKKKKPALFTEFVNTEGENMLLESLTDEGPLPNELFARKEVKDKLDKVLERLHPNERAVLSLRYNDHLTFQEIAKVLGEPLNTLKSRHHRAIINLRRILKG